MPRIPSLAYVYRYYLSIFLSMEKSRKFLQKKNKWKIAEAT